MLKVKEVHAGYGNIKVLKGVSLEVPDRSIVTYRHEVLNHRGELVLEATIKRMIKRTAATAA